MSTPTVGIGAALPLPTQATPGDFYILQTNVGNVTYIHNGVGWEVLTTIVGSTLNAADATSGSNGSGGSLTVRAGNGDGTGAGGGLTIQSGTPGASYNGGGSGLTLAATSARSGNNVGGDVAVQAGGGHGSGNGGNVFLTPGQSGSGVTGHVAVEHAGDFFIDPGDPGITTTTGYIFIGAISGTPSQTPTNAGSTLVPLVWDNTDHRLYVYESGAWHYIARTA